MADSSILGYPLFQRFTQEVFSKGRSVLIVGSPGEELTFAIKVVTPVGKDQ